MPEVQPLHVLSHLSPALLLVTLAKVSSLPAEKGVSHALTQNKKPSKRARQVTLFEHMLPARSQIFLSYHTGDQHCFHSELRTPRLTEVKGSTNSHPVSEWGTPCGDLGPLLFTLLPALNPVQKLQRGTFLRDGTVAL